MWPPFPHRLTQNVDIFRHKMISTQFSENTFENLQTSSRNIYKEKKKPRTSWTLCIMGTLYSILFGCHIMTTTMIKLLINQLSNQATRILFEKFHFDMVFRVSLQLCSLSKAKTMKINYSTLLVVNLFINSAKFQTTKNEHFK